MHCLSFLLKWLSSVGRWQKNWLLWWTQDKLNFWRQVMVALSHCQHVWHCSALSSLLASAACEIPAPLRLVESRRRDWRESRTSCPIGGVYLCRSLPFQSEGNTECVIWGAVREEHRPHSCGWGAHLFSHPVPGWLFSLFFISSGGWPEGGAGIWRAKGWTMYDGNGGCHKKLLFMASIRSATVP